MQNSLRAKKVLQATANKIASAQLIGLLGLLAIAIALVIAFYVSTQHLLSPAQLSPKFSCARAQIEGMVKIIEACYDTQHDEARVVVKSSMPEDIKLDSIKFSFKNSRGESLGVWECGGSCGDCVVLHGDETRTYYFAMPRPSDESVVVLSSDVCVLDRDKLDVCE
ncbi:hypothetical protein D6817_04300 [Candidatus Pacearchaeota archaeon]|nr:MAG: hypothetical protein D6817_04300 [Candidatus Pacearchaeota archaeon]